MKRGIHSSLRWALIVVKSHDSNVGRCSRNPDRADNRCFQASAPSRFGSPPDGPATTPRTLPTGPPPSSPGARSQDHHHGFIGMADFMGLACSEEDALDVWHAHRNSVPHGDYSTHGLQQETIQWMNETMARLLPPSLALRWGVTPTDLGA